MKEENQQYTRMQKGNSAWMTNIFIVYVNTIVRAIIMIIFIGLPLWALVIGFLNLHIAVFLLIYLFIAVLLSKQMQRIKVEKIREWIKR